MNVHREKPSSKNFFSSQSSLNINGSQSLSAPKLCKVCNRASFLKCMECDTIYCSSKCQVKDWERHQFEHFKKTQNNIHSMKNDNNFVKAQTEKTSVPRSVQNRLAIAVQKQGKVSFENKLELPVKAKAEHQISKMKPDTVATDKACSIDEKSIKLMVDTSLRKMITHRNFKQPVSMDIKDDEGYGYVKITAIEKTPTGCFYCWIVPYSFNDERIEYKKYLNEIYEDKNIPQIPPEFISQFKCNLVMAKIGGCWSRAKIVSASMNSSGGIVGVEDIDSGEKTILVMPQNGIKFAQDPEVLKFAYAMRVILENVDNPEKEIEVGNLLSVFLVIKNEDIYATVKKEEIEEVEVSQNLSQDKLAEISDKFGKMEIEDEASTQNDKRILINKMKQLFLITGNDVKLYYLDGSRLEAGKLHVCEAKPENQDTLDNIFDEIKAYVKANPSSNNYKAIPRELVLAKFRDGYFYRGVCISESDKNIKVRLLDFGNVLEVGVKDVMKMPAHLMHTCCSRTVEVQLASSRPITDVDIAETRELLMNKDSFTAKVELIPGTMKNVVTLDDSLVVFKK